jgi:hypothetical protein
MLAAEAARGGRAALSRYPVPEWVLVPSAAWVPQQVYLHPYPKELMLRNHVQVQALWPLEAEEIRTNSLITPLELRHEGPPEKSLAQAVRL